MSETERAAYLNSQVACALIEAAGMTAENMQREHRGESMAYTASDFNYLAEKFGIHHNAALGALGR